VYTSFFKRALDILLSSMALIVLSPLMLLVALVIRLQDGGPVVFRQARVGRDGRPFGFLKFRSMPVGTPNVVSTERSLIRITPFGRFIRRTSIDELMQLFNILTGDMSIVGPRPPIPTQENLIRFRRENGALSLRPGLTGWAQVNSYDHMPEEEKARLDGEYAAKLSFSFDLRIIIKTFLYLTKEPPTY
jgi:O-antigen biosynthesis protein WbqP